MIYDVYANFVCRQKWGDGTAYGQKELDRQEAQHGGKEREKLYFMSVHC